MPMKRNLVRTSVAAPWGKGAFLLVCFVVLVLRGCVPRTPDRSSFIPPEGKYDARILRDDFGIPHIFGKTDADAAYGLGFAECEDDATNVEDGVLLIRGRLASVRGKEFGKFDYISHLFRVREFVEQRYETDLSPDVRAVCEAFADGVNHFAAVYPRRMPNMDSRVTGHECVMGFVLKAPFFYGFNKQLEEVLQLKNVPELQKKDDRLAWLSEPDFFTRGLSIGSNSWAVAPKRSADGHTRLAVNSHQPWDGPVAWYEAHVHSEEGWDMRGGTFPGAPMIFVGHDANKGWCHTVNTPDLSDVYVLKMNPDNKNQYWFDGHWKDLEVRDAAIRVRLWGGFHWTVHRECLWSVHGPALRTDAGVFAFKFAGLGDLKSAEQWFRMNKARNFDEFYKAMEIQGVPSFNTLYADKTGMLFYAYNGKFPACAKGYDYRKMLPGDTSETLWTTWLPFSAVPKVRDPQSGFLQTCNSTPFWATDGPDNPKKEDFAPEMGIQTHLTNRSRRALELYGKDPSITAEEFIAYKHDAAYSVESKPNKERQEILALDVGGETLLKQAQDVLRAWDLRMDKDDVNAPLAVLTCVPPANAMTQLGGVKPRPYDPDRTARLRFAAHWLQDHFGTLQVKWGDFCRLRRGRVDAALAGGPDQLRHIDGSLADDGRLAANFGDGLYMIVDWAPDGTVSCKAVHNYGAASTDPKSPHYDDQVQRFADENLRDEPMTEADIRQHLAFEYRPGDFTDAWYTHAK